ncbi:MAG: NADPH-dependent F420 reductase [Actinomycetota bacterium]
MAAIAVIGSGKIGGTLATKWSAAGHAVTLGARDPDKPAVRDLAGRIGAGTAPIAQAVEGADVVVFAVPGSAMAEMVSALGTRLDGKLVIDTANNVGGESMNSRAAIEAAVPGASYCRAFNNLGWEQFDRPIVGGVQADLFFCGPDGDDRGTAEGLIADVGLRPVWVGGPEDVEVVDGVLGLWFSLVRKQGHSRRLAFKMIEE